MKRRYNILYFCVSHFLPFLFRSYHFFLLCMTSTFLDCHKLIFRYLHMLLQSFSLYPFTLCEVFVKFFNVDGLREFDNKKTFVFLFQKMCRCWVLSKIFAKISIALLRIEKLFNSPNAKRICESLIFYLFLKLFNVAPFSFK